MRTEWQAVDNASSSLEPSILSTALIKVSKYHFFKGKWVVILLLCLFYPASVPYQLQGLGPCHFTLLIFNFFIGKMQLPKFSLPTSVFLFICKILSNLEEKWHSRKKSPYQEPGSWSRQADVLSRSWSSCPVARRMVIWQLTSCYSQGGSPTSDLANKPARQGCSQRQTLLGWPSANEWARGGVRDWPLLSHGGLSRSHSLFGDAPRGAGRESRSSTY